MGSSSYHYNMYKKYQKEANNYGKLLNQLREIRSSITSYPVTSAVNSLCSSIKKCANEVESGLKGESMYATNVQLVRDATEREPLADSNLSAANHAVTLEINRITALKREAEINRDYQWRKYKEALAREAAEKAKSST